MTGFRLYDDSSAWYKNAAGTHVQAEPVPQTGMAAGDTGDMLTIKADDTVHPRTLVGTGGITVTVNDDDITVDGSGVSGSGGGGGAWSVAASWDFAVTGAVTSLEADVTNASDVLITFNEVSKSGSAQLGMQVSDDAGSSWFTTSGDYDELAAAGTLANNAAFHLHTSPTTAARTAAMILNGLQSSFVKHGTIYTRATHVRFKGSTTAINRVRAVPMISGSASGTFTGGTIAILVR